MRLGSVFVLVLLTACYTDGLTAPGALRGIAPAASPAESRICIDYCHPRATQPCVLIIDGVAFKFPEDSARFRLSPPGQVQPDDIESVEVVPASHGYKPWRCAAVVVTTKHHVVAPAPLGLP